MEAMLLMYMVPKVICSCTDCRMLPQVLSGPEHTALASSTPCSATSPHGQTPCEVVGAQDAPSWSGPIPTEGGGGYMVQEWPPRPPARLFLPVLQNPHMASAWGHPVILAMISCVESTFGLGPEAILLPAV